MSDSPETYGDSSFLLSLYCGDSNSEAARRLMARLAVPLVFNPFHRLEVRNGLRLRVYRGNMTHDEGKTALRQIEEDLADGILVPIPLPWTDALRKAEQLSESHAERIGSRAADTLHVAAALLGKIRTFLSFDERQCNLAEAAGLTVKP